jgi:putative glycosyltransferase (TIGR04372 family)
MSALIANIALNEKSIEKARPFIGRARKYGPSRKLAIHYEISVLESESANKLHNYLQASMTPSGIKDKSFDPVLAWGFWNLPYRDHINLLEKAQIALQDYSRIKGASSVRMLPEFTSNMGHMGYLTSYIGHYSITDPDREIALWGETAPNKYFLKLILEQSKLKIKLMDGIPKNYDLDSLDTDTLALSKSLENTWRIEQCSAAYSGQNFPELENKNRFVLEFPINESWYCIERLSKIGFNPNKWFVVLHVRGPKDNNKYSGQARDSLIHRYLEYCKMIVDLGGQVIRMGGKQFPALDSKFPAIDYAFSDINSNDIDCWLWANCRWWTGNMNGAAIAAYGFGATRLLTDQFYWDNFGPESDFYMPKLLSKDGQVLNITNTVDHKLSRNQDMSKFRNQGIDVIDNPQNLLALAAVDIFEGTSISAISNRDLPSNYSKLTKIEAEIASALNNSNTAQTMRIPPSFENFLKEKWA